jgi:hypothetical protein
MGMSFFRRRMRDYRSTYLEDDGEEGGEEVEGNFFSEERMLIGCIKGFAEGFAQREREAPGRKKMHRIVSAANAGPVQTSAEI